MSMMFPILYQYALANLTAMCTIIISCSCMKELYPRFTTEEEIIHFIESLPDKCDESSILYMIHLLVKNYQKLEAIGSSLPELVEFYKFLFCDLAQTISKEEAFKMTIKAKINDIVRSYENCDHLSELYYLVIGRHTIVDT